MAEQHSDRRRKLVIAAAKRILDLPDDAPVEELKAALDVFGLDTDAAVKRTEEFIRGYSGRLMEEMRIQHETELENFRQFQQEFSGIDMEELKNRISERINQLSQQVEPHLHAYYRDLSKKSTEDIKSELLDLLWQLEKLKEKKSP